jgi:hypothetical protein
MPPRIRLYATLRPLSKNHSYLSSSHRKYRPATQPEPENLEVVMRPVAEAFTYIDPSPYNARKMEAPYDKRLTGNTWQGSGARAKMPELDHETMQTAFQQCGEAMSVLFAHVYGLFSHGSQNFDTEFWEYYALKGHNNGISHHNFKLPFPADNLALREKNKECREEVRKILTDAMDTVGNLHFSGTLPAYILWEAGVVPNGGSAGSDNVLVGNEEERTVCWQPTLTQTFSHEGLSYGARWDGGYARRTAEIQISVGVYFKQTFGRYAPLVPGAVMSRGCTCDLFLESGQNLSLSNINTVFTVNEIGSFDVPGSTTQNFTHLPLNFDPFERSSVPYNHLNTQGDSASEASSGKATITLSRGQRTAPPSYRTQQSDKPPSYKTLWRKLHRR